MDIDISCFSKQGLRVAEMLVDALRKNNHRANAYRCQDRLGVHEWTEEFFHDTGALVYVGAVGIAVRAIAPHVQSKTTDPAVIVVDDKGKYVIPILSGHLGGANKLAQEIAELIGGEAVITTGTDIHDVFAVDVWAKENNITLTPEHNIKNISAKLLAGKQIRVRSAFQIMDPIPHWFWPADQSPDLVIDVCPKPRGHKALLAIPRAVVLGIGCRLGTHWLTLLSAFEKFCTKAKISQDSIARVCSIDLKRTDSFIWEFCSKIGGVPFVVFSAQELAAVPGEFTASEFVEETTGVDNVCERAAALGSGGGRVIAGKTVIDGVTFAANYLLRYFVDFNR